MANGYIGKISAVVTANTSDLSRRLAAAQGDFNKFANRLELSIGAASRKAGDSIDGIFTRYQRLERSLRSALEINLRTDREIKNIQQLVSVAEQINRPLASAASQAEKLGLGVQGAFLPALRAAQSEAERLSEALRGGGLISERAFASVEGTVNRTTQAIQRLTQAQQLAAQSFTGNELQFGNPRLFETLTANARTTQRAAALPASALVDGDIARQIRALDQYQNAAVEAAARVESLRLEPNVRPDVVLAAERRLQSIIETARRAGVQIEAAIAAADAPARAAVRDFAITGQAQNFEQARSEAQRLLGEVSQLPSGRSAFSGRLAQLDDIIAAGDLNELEQARRLIADIQSSLAERRRLDLIDREQLQAANQLADRIRAIDDAWDFAVRGIPASAEQIDREFQSLAARIGSLGIEDRLDLDPLIRDFAASVRAGGPLVQQFQRLLALRQRLEGIESPPAAADRIRRLTGNLNIDSTPVPGVFNEQAQRDIDALAGRVGQVRQQLETLPNSIRAQFIPALQQAAAQLTALQNSPRATAEEIDSARQSVDRLAQSASAASRALDFSDRFGGGARGFSGIFQDQALRGFTSQLEILQGVISRVSADARGPALASFARLRDVISTAFRSGTLEAEATQSRIRQLTAEAVEAAAAVSGIGRRTLNRQLERAGDIGRAGFDRFGLAVQQAAFAIDDFFSVTGGLDQRIRAVGNNLTQLGFILGGTAGLVTALAVTVGSQAVLGLIKFARGGAESADIAKALNSRLETQKRLAQEVSESFSSLAGDLADGAFSAAAKQADELGKKITGLIAKLRGLRDETASTLDPNVFLFEGRRVSLERRLEAADTVPLAAARQARLRNAERQVREARQEARRQDPIGREEIEDVINASYGAGVSTFRLPQGAGDQKILEILERREYTLAKTVDSWLATFLMPFEQADARQFIVAVRDARQRLDAGIADSVRGIAEGAISTSGRRFQAASSRAVSLLEQARRDAGETNATRSIQAAGEADARRSEELFQQLGRAVSAGRENEARAAAAGIAALADSAAAREREARAALDAARASARFAEVLGRFSELNNTIFGDLAGAAEQARRDAVQASGTASAGLTRSDDATFAAIRSSRLQDELAAARDRRTLIERQISTDRRRFEQESPDPEIRRLAEEAARARSLAESETASDFAKSQARERQIVLDQQLERRFAESGRGQALQAQLDEADRQARVAIERDGLITRGREIALTEGQRAARELDANLRAINAAFDDQVRQLEARDPFADAAGINAQRQAAIEQARQDAFRSAAPAIFGLADAVQNAILQGPSRAALEATDVSTVEGARELNRLLRGDDAARNQDLVQLQREANRLLQVIADGGGANVAN